ncbi:MAG TPA: MlaD family protein, partial [Gammaproteobacteria bacterium]|nr:MlaD family protein [Gammaproteobacteria bacterium]
METNVNYTIVGAFVIFLVTAIVLGIIWLSSGFSFQHYSTYLVHMQESVTGLTIDSPVEYNGVQVGNVTSIEINHDNPRQVELLLNIKKDTPITRGTFATLTSRGITGITYIALKDRGTDLRPLLVAPGQK